MGAALGATAVGDLRQHAALCGVLLLLAVLGAAVALWAALELAPTVLLTAALAARLAAFAGGPTLSDDEHRYVHEGRAQRIGLAVPYRTPPAAVLPRPDDGTTARVNHPDVPAAYPPGSELLLWATVALGDAVGAPRAPLRVVLMAADLLILALLFRRRRQEPLGWVRYGLHPLPILEVALSGHLDALGALLACAVVLAAARPRLAGALVGLAMHVKPIGLLGLVAVEGWRPRGRALLMAGLVAAGLALPHLLAGAPIGAGLLQYATRWRAAPLVYALLEAPLQPLFEARAARGAFAHLHVSVGPPAFLLEEQGRALMGAGVLPDVHTRILLDAGFFARLLAGALLAMAVLMVLRVVHKPAARVAAAFASAWLLMPTLHPWYLLWLVPLAALTGSRALWTFAALGPLLYQPVFALAAGGPWHEAVWPRAVVLIGTAVAAGVDWRSRARSARPR